MNDRIREQLLGYLLGALEDSEREDLERQLEANPDWQDELQTLMASLEPLAESYREADPPPGLAERTCSLVVGTCEQSVVTPARHAVQQPVRTELRRRSDWRIADVVVAAGVCLAAALLFFPAIAQSRYQARLLACQNNLRQLGVCLAEFSEQQGGGYFPAVPTGGKRGVAGIYGPTLVDTGYLTDPALVVCPSSRLAVERRRWQMPSLADIDRATGLALVLMQRTAGGTYGYNLGVVVDGEHRPPKNWGRSHFAIMADAPTWHISDHRSFNHDGRGENILYEDGHVEYVTKNVRLDHPFQNRLGSMEAGMDVNDSVVAPSPVPPFSSTAWNIHPTRN